jgi:hypothetical protein
VFTLAWGNEIKRFNLFVFFGGWQKENALPFF